MLAVFPIRARQLLLELILITIFSLFAVRSYLNMNPALTLDGREAQWLTSSAFFAAKNVQEYGYIPLWQHYMVRGEPSIDNPFSFYLNPFSILPSILIGYPNGIKISVLLSTLIVGFGAWFLAKILGFNAPARVLLGLLFIAKGPMAGVIGEGYFQLGTTQAYLPWVVGAAIAIGQQPRRRWAIVLLALSLVLLFWGGNIYFTLPAVVMTLLIMLTYSVRSRRPDDQVTHRFSVVFDQIVWQRIMLGLILAAGLAAITLIPIFAHQSYIGGHPNEKGAGTYTLPMAIIAQLFTNERFITSGVNQENYYIFTLPFWFAGVMFLILPLIERYFLSTPEAEHRLSQQWRIWVVGWICVVFFTLWGTGTNPVIGWAYANLPLIGQWRFVARMLTVLSFWIALFTIMRLDYVWKSTTPLILWQRWTTGDNAALGQFLTRGVLGLGIVILASTATWEVLTTRYDFGSINKEDATISTCMNWLREQHPGEMLTVYMRDYHSVSAFLRNNIRFANLTADFDVQGPPSTIFPYDLTKMLPFYLLPNIPEERDSWANLGYLPVAGSPTLDGTVPCVWTNANTVGYAFSIPKATLDTLALTQPKDVRLPLDPALTTPITGFNYRPERIAFNFINGDKQAQVIVVQEIAWPGWRVTMNGKPAQLESVGQLMGVIIPPGSGVLKIVFEYIPTLVYVSGILTILTAAFCILYLLKAERVLQSVRHLIDNRKLETMSVPVTSIEITPQAQLEAHHESSADRGTREAGFSTGK